MRTLALSAVLLTLTLAACESTGVGFVNQTTYDRDTGELRARVNELEATAYEYEVLRQENDRLRWELAQLRGRTDALSQLSAHLREMLTRIEREGLVTRNPDGSWSFGVDLLFRPGSDEISDQGRGILSEFAGVWRDQNVRFRILGHTDRDPIVASASRVTTRTNLELGMLRSRAVMMEFLRAGVAETRIIIESHGNNTPRAPNDDDAENKRRNRRVEIYVLPN